LADGEYAIDGTQASHYDRLLEALVAEGGCPRQAVHLWSLTGHGAEDEDPRELGASGFLSVNHLAQAVRRARLLREGFTISVVTNRVHSVTGRELLSPVKASILGACRVLPQELPRLTARLIDIDDDCFEPRRVPVTAEALAAEILSDSTEPVVALRRGYRWVQNFEAAWLADDSDRESRLREGGTYLITGGLGKIGLVIAFYLTQRWGANLVLTGRTSLPEPESWSEVLDAEPAGPVAAKLEALLGLQAEGAEVLYLACDVADQDAVDAVVAAAEQRFGRIDGVIHGAGLTEGLMGESEVTPLTAEAQLRPKAGGLAALASALEGRQIDFLLTLSSISAVLGGLGFLEYAAANCVMDAMCAEHNREGGAPWISVDWDAWDFSSDEWYGADEEEETAGILPSQGEAAFQRIVDRAPSHVVVSVGDLYARIDDWVRFSPHDASPSPPDVEAESHGRPDLATEFVPARTPTETHLVDLWQRLLGIAPIGTVDNFFELGGHSLLAIQVVSRISERFEIDLSVAKVFEAPTIAGLAELIDAGSESTSLTSEDVAELHEIVEQVSVDEPAVLQGTGTHRDQGAVPDD
jgi:NAD(P)-dependent dehydrogenase (short-subunit alcohol dehydrogenase family)